MGRGSRTGRGKALAQAGGALVAAVCLVACTLVPMACARAAPAFEITRFTLQATRTVEGAPPGTGAGENEPYAFGQAGGDPQALTSVLDFSTERSQGSNGEVTLPTQDVKDVAIQLPPGLTADPALMPACAAHNVTTGAPCAPATQVGTYALRLSGMTILGPVVNVAPHAGRPAELGLESPVRSLGELKSGSAKRSIFLIGGRVERAADGYVLALTAEGIPREVIAEQPASIGLTGLEVTLWGVPAEAIHDPQRGLFCAITGTGAGSRTCVGGGAASGYGAVPFLQMPSDCAAGPPIATAYASSWEEPQRWVSAQAALPAPSGCNLLSFEPEVKLQADTQLADDSVGMAVSIELGSSQEAAESAEGTQGTTIPPLRSATATLPQGVSLNPAGAQGLVGCAASGPQGIDIPTGLGESGRALTPGEVGPGETEGPDGLKRLSAGRCPQASVIGEAHASTPLLAQEMTGRVYLAQSLCGAQGQAACSESDALEGRLYRIYVELVGSGEEAGDVYVKLAGTIEADPADGQLTVKIDESPQLPLRRLTLKLNGGPRALLANPPTCGPATTSADLVPWSAPGTTPEGLFAAGTPDATSSTYYEVTGCASQIRLAPGFAAGTTLTQAGAFSPLTLTVTREDREQLLAGLQVHLPAGLLGMLGSVPLCGDVAAGEGACPAASRIGYSLVQAGAGSAPLQLGGDVYLTGPHGGSPYGLAIVTHAQAGPLDLGRVVIKARIEIDPNTGALTITSDPLPQILLGIPLRLRRITLDLDRPGFMLNPTDCSAKRIEAVVAGAQGASASVSSPFAVGGCKALEFKPAVSASTSGRASATGNGASLDVRLAFPVASTALTKTAPAGKVPASAPSPASPVGEQANLAQVKLVLPRALASRLTTLQGACEDVVFAANPAACPSSSVVGIVQASTPVLASAMAGPVYFVSHEGRAFPSLVAVLQGSGVRLDLTGSTEIEHSGATSIAFRQIPDVPVSSFEVYLPQGSHSALGAASSLCALSRVVTVKRRVLRRVHGRLVRRMVKVRKRIAHSALIPTALVAQNGLVSHRGAVLRVTGCGRTKPRRTRR